MTAALDIHLNRDQVDLYERTRSLATEFLAPIAAAGEPGRVNRPLVAALAEHGLLARLFERDHVSAIELCLIREGLARGCTEAETAFALQGLGAYPIAQAGSEALKAQWIPRGGRGHRRRGVRAHRARCRFRPGGAVAARGARRRRRIPPER